LGRVDAVTVVGRRPAQGDRNVKLVVAGAAGQAESPDAATPHPARRPRRVVLVGNPNVGKSVVFKSLTGRHVIIANYPGTTVEIVRARTRLNGADVELCDTPGLNDLGQPTDDARVTREIVEELPDAVLVQVADAKNLRRALLLTLQLAEMRRPLVLVLNMTDELESSGARIDAERLGQILGVPVVRTVAVRNEGISSLLEALPEARVPHRGLGRIPVGADDAERNLARMERVNRILSDTYSIEPPARPSLGVRLGFWAMHPVKGLFLLAAVLMVTFWLVGLLGAGTLVDFLETGLFQQRLNPLAIRAVDAMLPFPHQHSTDGLTFTFAVPLTPAHEIPLLEHTRTVITTDYAVEQPVSGLQSVFRFFHDLLVGEYGLITMALSYSLAIVLPIVSVFFLIFSLLEDSGYLPRMSIMVNRLFRVMGLSGKAVLPMILGLGCDTMAVMTTRILETRRDRIVTTVLLALAVPCSAQLGVLLAMMASLSFGAALFWVVLMGAVMVVVGWLTSRLFGTGNGGFTIELPPMRRPQAGNVLAKTLARLEWYLKEVIPLFALGTMILFLFDRLNLLSTIAALSEPLVTGWLGLPADTVHAFLIGFLRRDFGAVYLLDAATGPDRILSPHQVLVAMVTITLFIPCIATLFMIAREHGRRIALAIAAFIFPFAFLVGGLVHQLGRALGF
jgi:ferrous iron transport protein B